MIRNESIRLQRRYYHSGLVIEGQPQPMTNAIARRLNYSSSDGDLTQKISFVTDAAVRQDWKCLVLPFAKHQLAELTGVSAQAADLWIKGERAPSTASTLNAGRAIQSVRQWIAQRSCISASDLGATLDDVLMGLHAIAAQNTEDGGAARQLLVASYAIRTQSDETIPPMVRLAWKMIDKKIRSGG